MRSTEASRLTLAQAARRLETARRETRAGSPAYATRSAQECAELSLKAALRFVGVEYPKKHDVSPALLAVKERFPRWFKVERLARAGTWLAERREPAMYGDEAEGTTPDELFTREEAQTALGHAEGIYRSCRRLISG